ncbi:hypothetical protein KDA08_05205 [Candidatus Saccharibacteria bacterium]|nr:hypothetical protein [Candidatus Saccharibacteria bacterium]
MTTLIEILAQYEEEKQKTAEKVAEVFEKEIKEELKRIGKEVVYWKQYTPHFNDGDPCVFTVHGIYLPTDDDDVAEIKQDGLMLAETYSLGLDHKLDNIIYLAENFLQELYGDGVFVMVYADDRETVVEEVEHD